MSPQEELRAAASSLGTSPGRVVTIIETRQDENGDPIEATRHIIAVCAASHTGVHLDMHGCCQDCRYLYTYNDGDPELAAYVAKLLAAGPALRAWLKSWQGLDVREDGPHSDDWALALRAARAINGSKP